MNRYGKWTRASAWLVAGISLLVGPAVWGAQAGTPPTGEFSISGDAVQCSGTWMIPTCKSMTLTAINLSDRDINNEDEWVDDSISVIEWGISGTYGSFNGGTNGSPKVWWANPTTGTGVALRLFLKDAGNPFQDWATPQQVASINFDIVIPTEANEGTPTTPSCPPSTYGGTVRYPIESVSHPCAGLDFSGLHMDEDVTETSDTCNRPAPDTGDGCLIGSGNQFPPNCADTHSFCVSTCPVSASSQTCDTVMEILYYIESTSMVLDTITVTYHFDWNSGNCDLTITRSG